MGYTHYWKGKKSFTDAQFKAITRDFVKLYGALPRSTDTAGGYYADQPLMVERNIAKDEIRFDGTGPADSDLGHETFLLSQQPDAFEFCKTARKPYDLLVCATLIVCQKHAPDVLEITSDGDPEDWVPAQKFVRQVFDDSYGIPRGVLK